MLQDYTNFNLIASENLDYNKLAKR